MLTLKMLSSEVAEMTPEKERGMDEDAVDGRAEQHRRISQQGKGTIFHLSILDQNEIEIEKVVGDREKDPLADDLCLGSDGPPCFLR